MAYKINGLPTAPFAHLMGADDTTLSQSGAVRVKATADTGFPCRVSLEDAKAGESLILLNYTSHDVATPYRSAYAIYVREIALSPAHYCDAVPPVFAHRPLGLRGFGDDGMLKSAALALPGEADAKIRDLFSLADIAYIDVHNAAHGCFAARVERD